jgi:PPOX class probable F420-dependent enzyme
MTHLAPGGDPSARPPAAARPRVPASHADLLARPLPGILTTELGSGRLQSSVIWYWTDGDDVLLSTMAEFLKARNLRARPRATLLVLDADDRWVEVRADVREDPDPDPTATLDAVGVRYTGLAPYFGAVVPAHLAEVEHPVTFRLAPTSVVAGGPPTPAGPAPAPVPASVPPDDGAPARPDAPPPGLPLPATDVDLVDRPILAAFATRLPDGGACCQPARCARDGDVLLVATTAEHPWARNLRADPRATLLVVDPANSGRWMEVRADAELVADAAGAVTARLHARRIVCDAIHA